jgi:hypothetical protein
MAAAEGAMRDGFDGVMSGISGRRIIGRLLHV